MTDIEHHFLSILKGIVEDKSLHPDVRMLVVGDLFEEIGWLAAAHSLRSYAHCTDPVQENVSDVHNSDLHQRYLSEFRHVIGDYWQHQALIPRDIVLERVVLNAPSGYYTNPRTPDWSFRYYSNDGAPIAHNAPRDWGVWPFEDYNADDGCLDAWFTSDEYKISHPGTAHPDSFTGKVSPMPLEVFRFDQSTVGPQKCQCLATELHHCYT